MRDYKVSVFLKIVMNEYFLKKKKTIVPDVCPDTRVSDRQVQPTATDIINVCM